MAGEEPTDTWYLAQLKPNSARIAQDNLHRQKLRTFLPMETVTRQVSGRFVERRQPLFPGYLFVAFDAAKGLWRSVNSTRGVTKLVSFGSKPTAVPQDVMAALIAVTDETGQVLPEASFVPGDNVKFRTGPFSDFVAEIQSIDPDQRVWVLMEIMGRQTRMRVDTSRLKAV